MSESTWLLSRHQVVRGWRWGTDAGGCYPVRRGALCKTQLFTLRNRLSEGFKGQKSTSSENRCSALKKDFTYRSNTFLPGTLKGKKQLLYNIIQHFQFVLSSFIIANKNNAKKRRRKETPHMSLVLKKKKKDKLLQSMYHHNGRNSSILALLSKPINWFLYLFPVQVGITCLFILKECQNFQYSYYESYAHDY